VFAQESAAEIESRWDDLAASLAERFAKTAALMDEAKEDVLTFRHFPKDHWRKIWSTNLLERVNVAPRGALCKALHQAPHKGCGHLPQRRRQWPPADFVYTRLVGEVLLEQHELWQLEGRLMFSAESMAAIPDLDDIPAKLSASA
jgi:putative transposase